VHFEERGREGGWLGCMPHVSGAPSALRWAALSYSSAGARSILECRRIELLG
jgi:hypothetical protein